MQADIDGIAFQGVIESLARPTDILVPKREQFSAEMMAHAITEDPVKVFKQFFL